MLQNTPPHYTETEKLKQEQACESVVSESFVILSFFYTTNWYTLHLRVQQYVISRCQLFYAFWLQRTIKIELAIKPTIHTTNVSAYSYLEMENS